MSPQTPRRPYFLDPSLDGGRASEAHVVRPAAFTHGNAPSIRPLFSNSVLEPLTEFAPLEPLDPGFDEAPLEPAPLVFESVTHEDEPPETPVMDLTPVGLPPEAAARLEQAIARIDAMAAELREQAALDALDLGLELARRILKSELTARPEAIIPSLRDAVARLAGSSSLTVRLHPDDAAMLGQSDTAARLGVPGSVVRVVADESLERGDCLADDGLGVRVEATVAARLARVREALGEELS